MTCVSQSEADSGYMLTTVFQMDPCLLLSSGVSLTYELVTSVLPQKSQWLLALLPTPVTQKNLLLHHLTCLPELRPSTRTHREVKSYFLSFYSIKLSRVKLWTHWTKAGNISMTESCHLETQINWFVNAQRRSFSNSRTKQLHNIYWGSLKS